jgi:heme A synthase
MVHRTFALVVAGLVFAVAARFWRSEDAWARGLARWAAGLVVAQIALGMLTIVTFKELTSVTGHLLVAALLLAALVSLLVRTRSAPAGAAQPSPAPAELAGAKL